MPGAASAFGQRRMTVMNPAWVNSAFGQRNGTLMARNEGEARPGMQAKSRIPFWTDAGVNRTTGFS